MDRSRATLIGSLVAVAVASVMLLVLLARRGPTPTAGDTTSKTAPATTQQTTTATPQPATATAPTPTSTTTAAPTPIAFDTGNPAGSSSLEAALADPSPFVARDAIADAVARKDVDALPALEKIDLSKDGYVAAATIQGVGKLAAIAEASTKHDAVQALDRWLRDETKRGTPDAIGNASIAIDALHDTGSSEAIATLVAALDSGAEPLHLETRIVQTLDAMDARTAAPAIERFEARVRARTPHDDLEKELMAEAIAAADAALARWR